MCHNLNRMVLVAMILAIGLLVGNSSVGRADIILPNLPLGSQYQLMFVTAGSRYATSTDIEDYNAFVTAEAQQNPSLPAGITWKALGSTPFVDARDNAPAYQSIPIYSTRGERLFADYAPLWGFPGIPETGSMAWDQFGNWRDTLVYTGTIPIGTKWPGWELGGANGTIQGASSVYWDTSWIAKWAGNNDLQLLGVYALSSPITVVPEPTSVVMMVGLVLSLGLGWGVLRRRTPGMG